MLVELEMIATSHLLMRAYVTCWSNFCSMTWDTGQWNESFLFASWLLVIYIEVTYILLMYSGAPSQLFYC